MAFDKLAALVVGVDPRRALPMMMLAVAVDPLPQAVVEHHIH